MTSQTSLAPRGGPNGASQPSPLISFMPIVVVCGILYMLVIRPQQKAAKAQRRMVDELKVGDRVLTQGGILGNVAALKGTTLQIKIADNVKVEVTRASITEVLQPTSGTSAPTEVVS